MDNSYILNLQGAWIALAALNLMIQVAFFYKDRSQRLFIAKRITTPALLLLALVIVVLGTGGFPLIPCAILLAMGVGELGMEGSNLVQAETEADENPKETSLIVTLAGVLFLLVNLFIGVTLLGRIAVFLTIAVNLAVSAIFLYCLFFLLFKIFNPPAETRTQVMLYLIGVSILFAGALTDFSVSLSTLGLAAFILTISDSLVLVRMVSDFPKNTISGFRIQFAFLVVILLLYYVYMGLLIHIGSPFAFIW